MNNIQELKILLKNGDPEMVLSFVNSHPEVLHEQDESNATGLLLLAYQSNKQTLHKITRLVKKFNFYEAIVYGQDDDVVSELKKHPEFIDAYSPDGFTPIALACFFEQAGIANFLIKQGANPNIQANNGSKVNALHAAVAKNNVELCNLLIKNGANVNITQTQNVTALHSATHRGNLIIVKLLIENGANTSIKMDNGDTALSIASREGHQPVQNYLESLRTS